MSSSIRSTVLAIGFGAFILASVSGVSLGASATAYTPISDTDAYTFGPAITTFVASGSSYAGITSTVIAQTGSSPDILYSTASLLGGTNTGANTNVSMAWRVRTPLEIDGMPYSMFTYPQYPTMGQYYQSNTGGPNGFGTALAIDQYNLASDVLNLTNVNGPYVLEMNYDPSKLYYAQTRYDEALLDQWNKIYLGWFETNSNPKGLQANYDEWVNATAGNSTTGSKAVENYKGTFAKFLTAHGDFNVTDYLGSFGTDIATHTTWAVLDHNSQFSVVPEPGTLCLLAAGLVPLLRRRRK